MKNLRDFVFIEVFQSKLENYDFAQTYKVLVLLLEA